MLNAIIVDDEVKGVETLRLMLREYCPDVNIAAAAYSVNEAAAKINSLNPDLVFLDIQMPFADGFALFEKIKIPAFEVIFTTAFSEYAVKAFKHNAVDYLLKPVKSSELISAVNKCREIRNRTTQMQRLESKLNLLKEAFALHKIPVHTSSETILVDVDEIIRLEADGNYTHIHLSYGKKILSTKAMAEYEKLLPGDVFLRIHKKHLVNRTHINTIKKGEGLLIMTDGSAVEISRLKKAYILSVLAV